MTETQLSKKFIEKLRKDLRHPEELVVFKHTERFNVGVPDYSLNYEGQTAWVEFKKVGGKVSSVQQRVHTKLQNSWIVWLGAEDDFEERQSMLSILEHLEYNS